MKVADIKIHRVVDGPYNDEEKGEWWIVALVEEGGIIQIDEVMAPDFNTLYNVIKYLNQPTLDPYCATAYLIPDYEG